jgi:hypothetical protein
MLPDLDSDSGVPVRSASLTRRLSMLSRSVARLIGALSARLRLEFSCWTCSRRVKV